MQPESPSAPKPVMDVSPPTLPRPAAPVAGTPPSSSAHGVSIAPPAVKAVPTPPAAPLAVKPAPLANLEVVENNDSSSSAPSPSPLPSMPEDAPETPAAKTSVQPKKAPPQGPHPPFALIVVTVFCMLALSGIAVAIYMTSSSS